MPRGGNVLRQRLAFRKQLQGREPPRSRHHLIGAGSVATAQAAAAILRFKLDYFKNGILEVWDGDAGRTLGRPAADLLCPGLAARRLAGGIGQFQVAGRSIPRP
jgi:hypothetical protein